METKYTKTPSGYPSEEDEEESRKTLSQAAAIALKEAAGSATKEEKVEKERLLFQVLIKGYVKPGHDSTPLFNYYWHDYKKKNQLFRILLVKTPPTRDKRINFCFVNFPAEEMILYRYWQAIVWSMEPKKREDLFVRPITIKEFDAVLGPAILKYRRELAPLLGTKEVPLDPLPYFDFLVSAMAGCKCKWVGTPRERGEARVGSLPHLDCLVFE